LDVRLAEVNGGSLRNAIPRESTVTVAVKTSRVDAFKTYVNDFYNELNNEYKTTDPDLEIVLTAVDAPKTAMDSADQSKFLNAIYACQLGVYRMSPDMEDLVQTSNNIARVIVADGNYKVMCLTRGSVDSEKMDLANSIKATFNLIGADVDFAGSYPGWEPKPGSDIVDLMSEIYAERFGEKAKVNACHAGLECGILGTNYPHIEMISFGPNIKGAHSPDERTQISSVQKYWGFLLETLKRTK